MVIQKVPVPLPVPLFGLRLLGLVFGEVPGLRLVTATQTD